MSQQKRCTRCGKNKELNKFSKHRLSKDGHAWQCKECNSQRGKLYRETISGIYSRIRGRAIYEKKKPFNMNKSDFEAWYNSQPKQCVYCGISENDVFLWTDNYNPLVKKLSIDCMNNDVGYVVENIVLACERCNLIKGNMFSHEQMLDIGSRHVRHIWEKLKRERKN